MTDKKTVTPILKPDDPAEDAVPLDQIRDTAVTPTEPRVETALDDDEGGADAVDPDTGRPYANRDAGVATPPAGRKGGTGEG